MKKKFVPISSIKVGTKEAFDKIDSHSFIRVNDCEFYIDRTTEGDILYLVVPDTTGADFIATNNLY